nr:MAG TPA: hypothetical protein [Bacteriophage sp.]DAQ28500.1 MAG TPA: hypothetical protein [Caudoviricetes sp.]
MPKRFSNNFHVLNGYYSLCSFLCEIIYQVLILELSSINT